MDQNKSNPEQQQATQPAEPPKKKRKGGLTVGIIVIAVIIIIVIIAQSCGGGESKPTSISSGTGTTSSEAQQSETKESKPEKTVFKVGETVKYGNVELTVTKFKTSKGGEFDSPKTGNEYAIVTVKYKNTGKENISYNPFDFKIRNSKGQVTDNTYISAIEKDKLDSGDLAPGGEVEGSIAFEVPKGDKGLVLQYTGNIFESESKVEFKLT
jgi:hypothetical protein